VTNFLPEYFEPHRSSECSKMEGTCAVLLHH
jgi:hypothetical protein